MSTVSWNLKPANIPEFEDDIEWEMYAGDEVGLGYVDDGHRPRVGSPGMSKSAESALRRL